MSVEIPNLVRAMASIVGVGASTPRFLKNAGFESVVYGAIPGLGNGFTLTLSENVDASDFQVFCQARNGYARAFTVYLPTVAPFNEITVIPLGADGSAETCDFDIMVQQFPSYLHSGTVGTPVVPDFNPGLPVGGGASGLIDNGGAGTNHVTNGTFSSSRFLKIDNTGKIAVDVPEIIWPILAATVDDTGAFKASASRANGYPSFTTVTKLGAGDYQLNLDGVLPDAVEQYVVLLGSQAAQIVVAAAVDPAKDKIRVNTNLDTGVATDADFSILVVRMGNILT